MEGIGIPTILSKMTNKVLQVGNLIKGAKWTNPHCGRVYDTEGICPCLNTVGGGNLEVKIIQRGRGFNKGGEHNIAPTITNNSYQNNNFVVDTQERIRRLTPREYFRLMGVDDADIDTIQSAGISNSQQYKMAGNSIVVDVLYHIFRQAFCEEKPKARYIQQTLF